MMQVYYLAQVVNPRDGITEDDVFTTASAYKLEDIKKLGMEKSLDQMLLSAITVKGRLLMHVAGKVADAEANCLFDSGAETNVISKSFAQRQGVVITPSAGSVELGNSSVTDQVGTARGFVQFGVFHKAVPCLVLESLLNGVDFIFGDQFMRAHSCVLHYGKSRISLLKGKRRMTVMQRRLARDKLSMPQSKKNEEVPKLISAMQVKRLLRKGHQVMLGVVTECKDDVTSGPEVKPWVQGLQQEFSDMFADPLPLGLPPERTFGHTIPTEPGHIPPFRPMYRLSPLEMRETKEQLTRFMEQGGIEPSNFPYGAPILFVPKPN
jgi:hypothetical protein